MSAFRKQTNALVTPHVGHSILNISLIKQVASRKYNDR